MNLKAGDLIYWSCRSEKVPLAAEHLYLVLKTAKGSSRFNEFRVDVFGLKEKRMTEDALFFTTDNIILVNID